MYALLAECLLLRIIVTDPMPPATLAGATPSSTTEQLSARLQELERWRTSVLSGDLEALRQRKQRLQEDLRGYEELEANVAKLIAVSGKEAAIAKLQVTEG